jgi:Zn-dependent peptidase ImmA (M78 family)/transcriptional regulator with XRE-family HTH domain
MAHVAVGERVAEARAESGLTQAQLATTVGITRSALAKIETGARRVTAVELVAIARELRRRVEWFVDPGTPSIVSYRASKSVIATQTIDTELDRIVRDVEFVASEVPELIGQQPARQDTPMTMSAADDLAATARTLLELEPHAPAHNLSRLVVRIGLLPFALPLGQGADAGTALLRTGGISVINGDLRVGRRRLALAHELGHYLIADPYTTDWRIAWTDADALETRLDRFARALLLPETDLRGRWAQWIAAPDESLRDASVRAGSHYHVDMATLARRLSELGLIDAGQANDVRQIRTKKADIVEKNLIVPHELEPVSLPRAYEQAILQLYRREAITVSRALGLLRDTFDEDALPDRPPAPEAEIWAVTS